MPEIRMRPVRKRKFHDAKIWALIDAGHTVEEAAKRMGCSEATVWNSMHRRRVLDEAAKEKKTNEP